MKKFNSRRRVKQVKCVNRISVVWCKRKSSRVALWADTMRLTSVITIINNLKNYYNPTTEVLALHASKYLSNCIEQFCSDSSYMLMKLIKTSRRMFPIFVMSDCSHQRLWLLFPFFLFSVVLSWSMSMRHRTVANRYKLEKWIWRHFFQWNYTVVPAWRVARSVTSFCQYVVTRESILVVRTKNYWVINVED